MFSFVVCSNTYDTYASPFQLSVSIH